MDYYQLEGIAVVLCPDFQHDKYAYLVTAWFVEPGEYLCAGDMLCEITIANIAITIHAPFSGHLKQIFRNINEFTSPREELCHINVGV